VIRRGTSKVHQAIAAAIAAWLSVVLAALACAVEMSISGTAAAAEVIPAMLGIHALIGLPEAAISAAVIALADYAVSPHSTSLPSANHHLSRSQAPQSIGRQSKWAFAMAAGLIALSPFASTLPDGLERMAENLNLPHHHAADVAPASADE
jgi:cobalt/nickel transport system permease protein